jgi:ABC-type branched-subunit amino acid transport system substrate-binding protein
LGFQVFFSRINANGGVNGHKVVLDVQDDHFSPPETVSLVKKTISDTKSLALFATVGTANLGALIKSGVLTDNKMALVGPVSGLPALLGAPNVFPVRASYFDELRQIAKHSHTILLKRAVFLQLETPVAADLSKVLASGLSEDGRQLLDSVAIAPVQDAAQMNQNVDKAVDKVLASSPDMCVVFGPGNIGPDIINAIRKKVGSAVRIYLMSVSSAEDVVRASGVQYQTDMKKYAPNVKLSHLTLEGYLGAMVLYEGMKRAGANLNRASLLSALNSVGKFDFGDFEVDSNPSTKRGTNQVDTTMINQAGLLIH